MKSRNLFSLLLLPLTAYSAQTLSWEDCVSLTSKNNADLQAALSSLQATEYQEGAARSGFLPQLSANLGFSRGSSTTTNTGFITSSGTNYSASVSGSENLFAGFQDYGKTKQARANTEVSASSLQTTKARISFELKSAFESLSYAEGYLKMTHQIIQRRQENLRLVELRFESGRENKGSVLLSKAYLNQSKYDELQAGNAKKVSHAQLSRSLGIDEFTDFVITGEIPVQSPQSTPDVKSLALQTPDYRQAVSQEDLAGAALIVARSQFFPSLNLTGALGRQGPDFFPDAIHNWSVGLGLSFPFFSGGRDFYATKSAISAREAANRNREGVSRSVLAKLQQAYSTYIEAVSKLKVDESFKEAALVRAEIARKRYNNGLMTFEDWDIIENDLISRQKTFLQSKRDRVIAEAAWEQAQGKGVIQ